MNHLEDQPSHASKLCDQCSKVDFESLFSWELKAFWLGKLSTIMQNDNCPFCRLIVHALHKKSPELGSSWEAADRASIDVWVKTTLWALQDSERHSDSDFRYRPALGMTWMPEDRRNWDRAKCLTICELDSVLIEPHEYFPENLPQDSSQILRRRLIPAELDLNLVRTWIEHCENKHCHPIDKVNLQTQLRATEQFRLYDVVQSQLVQPTNHVKYMALSYVWGDALRARQLANPSGWWDDFFDGAEPCQSAEGGRHVPFSRLPVTIQDASLIVQRLGWRYLWVDLLCVSQNDQSQKQLLIDMMHIVYKGASITLVAAGGTNAESPLHGLRGGTRCSEDQWTIPTTKGDISLVIARPELQGLLSCSSWRSRGWTFQEDILSACCLYFTQEEVFYSCDHHTTGRLSLGAYLMFPIRRFSEWREGYVLESRKSLTAYQSSSVWNEAFARSTSPGLRFAAGAMRDWDFSDYAYLVHKFSQRTLTDPNDILRAFSGILSNFSKEQTLDTDVKLHGLLRDGGLPNGSLAQALLWIPSRATALRRRGAELSGRWTAPRFPSWSWSGWEGEVEYPVKRCSGERHDTPWIFSPATFEPKQSNLRIGDMFKWTVQNNDRIVAALAEVSQPLDEAPEKGPADYDVCTLTLFTYVADTTLTEHRGFMSQNHQTWTDHVFYKMRPYDKGDLSIWGYPRGPLKTTRGIGVFPDAGTLSLSRNYKLVSIGKCWNPSALLGLQERYVVLLVEEKGDAYERRGLSVVPISSVQWTIQWISLV